MNEGEAPMNDTKPDTLKDNEFDELKGELQRLADKAAGTRPQVSDAALALIAALEYDDETLVKSSSASLAAGLAELANDCVARALSASDGTQAGLREGWRRYIDKKAYELAVLEDIKDKIESIIDEQIAGMLKLRRFVQGVEELSQHVKKSQALEEGIRELRKFREDLLRGWPSRRPPSPIDREAVSKAREAILRGEKGMSKDQLMWRDKGSEKAV
jgi:hypothetical protein